MVTINRLIKSVFTASFVLLFFIFKADAQNLTETQTDRLFKTGQLWGHLIYFHPYLQYKKIAFDSAYIAAVPKILAAQSDSNLSSALNDWLSILDDKITFAEVKTTTNQEEKKFVADFQKKNDIGVMTFSGSLSDWNKVAEILNSYLDKVLSLKGLVIDCSDITEDFGWIFEYSGFDSQLFSETISTLGTRSIAHSGFVPETGGTSGGYQTYFKNYPPTTKTGSLPQGIPVVFIVSSKTILPEVAWAMRKAGKAMIISNSELVDKQNAISYAFSENINISIRLIESLTSSTKADLVFDILEKNEMIEKALELVAMNNFKAQTNLSNLGIELVEKNPNYSKGMYPPMGERALAVAKIYSVINNFFPNKKLMTVNWDSVVKKYISPIVMAKDSAEYQLGVNALYANIQDGHGFVYGSLVNKIVNGGRDATAVLGSVIDGKFVVTTIVNDSIANSAGIQKGDIVLKRNGRLIFEIINELKHYKAHSNDVTGTWYASSILFRGLNKTQGIYTIQKKDGRVVDVKLPFSIELTRSSQSKSSGRYNEAMLRFLSPEIGYADLDRLQSSEVDSMFTMFKNTKAIVFDMRGYPSGTAWSIAPRLTSKKFVPAAKFTRLETNEPQIVIENDDSSLSETWTSFVQNIPNPDPEKEQYKGKTIMLINEETQSQAEHTGLFFRAANGTKFIGSQTAGANGDVTNFTIPGGMTLYFSGQTVWFPDGKQLQRTGLEPDILVRPTLKGIQENRDEVLERAIKYLTEGN